MEDLEASDWFPSLAIPIIDTLLAFRHIKDTCFSWELEEGWEAAINSYSSMFSELQQYAQSDLKLKLLCTWKIHIIICHLKTFLTRVSYINITTFTSS